MVKKRLNPVEFDLWCCWFPFLLPANGIFDSFVFRALVQVQMEPVSVVLFVTDIFCKSRIWSKEKNQKLAETYLYAPNLSEHEIS